MNIVKLAKNQTIFINSKESLDLTKQWLNQVPSEWISNSKFRIIRLSSNKLTTLPEEIWDLLFLKALFVDDNHLRCLPQGIGKLYNLKFLDFHSNKIEEIPMQIGTWVSLQKINAKYNNFSVLPASIGKLDKLQIFDIEWFKYWIPPIKYSFNKDSETNKETLQPIMRKLKELCNLFMESGKVTLNVFLNYFSSDANYKVKKEPDFNKQDNRKRTILHRAATSGHVGVVKGLLWIENIDPNQLEKDQWTPLGLALRDENDEIAQILLEKDKVDVNAGNGSFGAPLHIAVSKGKVDILKKLIKKKADVNKLDFKKQTPLHIIMDVFSRDVKIAEEITRILVLNGSQLNIMDSEKLSPLHRAVIK